MRRIAFVVPGRLDTLTGGSVYDRRIVDGLRGSGQEIEVLELAGAFPWPDAAARAEAQARLEGVPDGCLVVADGLVFGALAELARQQSQRLRWLALVHHPLALETGLDARQRAALHDSERAALAHAHAVIVPSPATARAVAGLGVAPARVHVVEPGTDPAPLARGSGTGGRLLCVATLTPRKGHGVLVGALAALQDRPWTLDCVGSTAREPATVAAVRSAIVGHGLQQRVQLHGELAGAALQAMYARADVFVLPSFHEGYGMVLTEALAHGLPIVSTLAGAIPETVPAGAGLLVPAGDVPALRDALAQWLDDGSRRAALAAAARAARARLPGWDRSVRRFAAVLNEAAA